MGTCPVDLVAKLRRKVSDGAASRALQEAQLACE